MDNHAPTPSAFRDALLKADDILLVVRPPTKAAQPAPGQPGAGSDYLASVPELFIAVCATGRIFAFNGHVDLGTGISTSLAQIVADELDVDMSRVDVVLGHTEATPNQGPTIASATIQITAVPLRNAAAQARTHLLKLAESHLGVGSAEMTVEDGLARAPDGTHVSYWQLLRGSRYVLNLAQGAQTKASTDYRYVGKSAQRVDIPKKATGEFEYIHDFKLPGMLHGRVVRPPYGGIDSGKFIGRSLIAVDASSVSHIPGLVDVVVQGDFIGVVAEREEQAIQAARELKTTWAPIPHAPSLHHLEDALRRATSHPRSLLTSDEIDEALDAAKHRLERSYVWPYQMHGSIGPSCAVADFRGNRLTVWSGTQNPHVARIDLNRLLGIGEANIEVIRLQAAGCYGRNCADDVCADAALLSIAVARPVRVQLSREQEHIWEPKGAAQLMDVKGAIDSQGRLKAYDFTTRYPSNDAPMLALLLTGAIPSEPRTLEMGDRTSVPPYDYETMRITCHDMPPIVRSAWLRGVSAMPNSFAHESFIDELAHAANEDPLAFRLRHLSDVRAIELSRAVAAKAKWVEKATGSRGTPDRNGKLKGRGFAYARYVHSRFPGFGAAWAAWIVDIIVDSKDGSVTMERIVVGQDTGLVVNPAGVRHQIHGNVIQTLSRVMKERVSFDEAGVTSKEWGAYPIISFDEIPEIEVVLMPRQDQPPLGAGESASVPGPAAIANALFDATGHRFRKVPFTPGLVKATLSN